MLVGRRMTARPVTVEPGARVEEARRLLEQHRIRHLPVVEGQRLVGIVTDRDLRMAAGLPQTAAPMVVADVMTPSVITVGPETTIEHAAMLMADNKIGGLPVVNDDDELVGIVTESDILNVFLEATGVGSGAARLELLLPDRPGALAPAAQALGDLGVNIISILSASAEEGKKVLIVRVDAVALEPVLEALARAGVEVQAVEEATR
jgi:acetoin utilization protein AcuB